MTTPKNEHLNTHHAAKVGRKCECETLRARIAELEGVLKEIKPTADHGIHGELDMFDALEEIHKLAKQAIAKEG